MRRFIIAIMWLLCFSALLLGGCYTQHKGETKRSDTHKDLEVPQPFPDGQGIIRDLPQDPHNFDPPAERPKPGENLK